MRNVVSRRCAAGVGTELWHAGDLVPKRLRTLFASPRRPLRTTLIATLSTWSGKWVGTRKADRHPLPSKVSGEWKTLPLRVQARVRSARLGEATRAAFVFPGQ